MQRRPRLTPLPRQNPRQTSRQTSRQSPPHPLVKPKRRVQPPSRRLLSCPLRRSNARLKRAHLKRLRLCRPRPLFSFLKQPRQSHHLLRPHPRQQCRSALPLRLRRRQWQNKSRMRHASLQTMLRWVCPPPSTMLHLPLCLRPPSNRQQRPSQRKQRKAPHSRQRQPRQRPWCLLQSRRWSHRPLRSCHMQRQPTRHRRLHRIPCQRLRIPHPKPRIPHPKPHQPLSLLHQRLPHLL